MVITPDNRTLIISESFAGQLTAFDIDADGGLSRRGVFAGGLGPDGICLDAEGAGAGPPPAGPRGQEGGPGSPRAAKSGSASNCPGTGPRSR